MNATNLLLLDCSPRNDDNSTSRYFTEHLLPALTARTGRNIQVTRRKLGAEPLPPLTAEYAESLLLPATEAREQYGAALAVSDQLIQELDAADVLWISTPVHNFTVPAALKTWIDLVVRRDVTFVATEKGKVGLLRDRPTYIAVTSGGAMFHEPPRQPDFFRPYLTTVLGVIGIKDITFVHATGLAFVEEPLTVLEEKAAQWTIRD
ncbi:FMN-dependent NADH-azoreductase [Burkholderia cenocepacia]|uniref:FMN-dependent NADH-azoreductase n=1 Tax=Burkholderia cenocepacia TaxID=95486 RepID=UPI001CF56126|nr:NAD(P)H-dependent oxidoreductase [Burkholderia cenocepacia]MCA8005942.1 NAD(P)H-dependent oxidoreductase [Burkholderia cenocepacia]